MEQDTHEFFNQSKHEETTTFLRHYLKEAYINVDYEEYNSFKNHLLSFISYNKFHKFILSGVQKQKALPIKKTEKNYTKYPFDSYYKEENILPYDLMSQVQNSTFLDSEKKNLANITRTVKKESLRNFSATMTYSINLHSDWVWSLDYFPKLQQFSSGSSDKTVRIFDLPGRTCMQVFKKHLGYILLF